MSQLTAKFVSERYEKRDGIAGKVRTYEEFIPCDPIQERAALDEAYNNTVASLEADEVEIARL